MRFLVMSRNRQMMPPEMALPMMEMMQAWVAEHTASGKMEQIWSFAGVVGGGGILDVDSLDELDAIMGGFPFAQTSDVEVYGLADLDVTLAQGVERIKAMLPPG